MYGLNNTPLPLCIHSQGESLGQGSFTRLYKGYKSDLREGRKHVPVFLKELDVTHRNLWEVGLCSRCTCDTFHP